MEDFYNQHYIITRPDGAIVDGWSNGPHSERDPTEGLCINEKGGYQFRLFHTGEENPPLFTMDGIPLYKWIDGRAELRTDEEVEAERAARPAPEPTPQERTESKLDFLMILNGMMGAPVQTFSLRAQPPTVWEYINKYYPRLWDHTYLSKLVQEGIITEQDYERLVEG